MVVDGDEYRTSGMIFDLDMAFGEYDPELYERMDEDPEAIAVQDATYDFKFRSQDFMPIVAPGSGTTKLKNGCEEIPLMFEQLQDGSIILVLMIQVRSRHDEDAPLLDDIKPLLAYPDACTTEVKKCTGACSQDCDSRVNVISHLKTNVRKTFLRSVTEWGGMSAVRQSYAGFKVANTFY